MKKFLATLLVLGTLLTLSVSSAVAAGATVFRAPLVESFIHPCTGEALTFTGTIQVVTKTTTDASGGIHNIFELNVANAKAVGASGAKYVGTGGFWGEFTASSNGTLTATGVGVFNLIGQGSTGNFVVHEAFHITMTPSGEIAVFFEKLSAECH